MKKKRKTKHRVVRRIILTLLLLAILAAAVYTGLMMLRREYTVTYDSYTASIGSISNSFSFSGNLSLIDSANYTSPASVTVRTVYAAPGDRVSEGDKLVRLSNGTTVKSGLDGTVNTVSVSEGDSVSEGANLLQVADFEHMKVTLRVDEYDIADIAIGQNCTVTVISNGSSYPSTIASIDRISASGGSVAYYTATAYVDITDTQTLPGMQVTVTVPQEEALDAVILKADALSFDITNRAYVWMKDAEDALTQVYVTTGVSNGNYVEIREGLSAGDEVFVEVEKEEASTLSGLLSGLFGSRQFNGSSRGMNGRSSGSRPDMSNMGGSFGGSGALPNMGGSRGQGSSNGGGGK